MNQFSIKVSSVAAAMNLLDELAWHAISWQITGNLGVEEVSLSFRTDLDRYHVEVILDECEGLNTLQQDI